MRPLFGLTCLLAFSPYSAAQAPAAQAPTAEAPATERLIVTFAEAPHERRLALRRAFLDRRPAKEIEAIIDRWATDVAASRQSFGEHVRDLGGEVRDHFWLIPASSISAPEGSRSAIESLPGVKRVWSNALRGPGDATPIGTATNAANHNADAVQAQGIDGAGVTVAIVDSSFDTDMNGIGRPHAVFFPGGDPTMATGAGLGGSRLLDAVQVGASLPDSPLTSHGTRVAAVAIGGKWNNTPFADFGHAPGADVIGYSINDDAIGYAPPGFAEISTMVAAFQRVVIDAATHGTRVANMSYAGFDFADSPEQQAIDAAAFVADLVVTVSAGQHPSLYHGAVNAMPVGMTDADTRTIPASSATGPQADGRQYPLIVANGNGIDTPQIDDESISVVSAGTSHAAPQVAGAAALFRSVATNATALETRAALLTTTEDIADVATPETRGHGYLRDDRLVALAQGGGLLRSGSLHLTGGADSHTMAVTQGLKYAATLCWDRQIVTNAQWADLDLQVWQGGVLVTESARVLDVNERVEFRAAATGSVELRVVPNAFEPGTVTQPYGLAAAEAPDAILDPVIRPLGFGCPSAPIAGATIDVRPMGTEASFQPSSTNQVFGGGSHRLQVLYDDSFFIGSRTIRALGFRFDEAALPAASPQWVDLEIDIGQHDVDDATVFTQTSFAANQATNMIRAVARRTIVLRPVQSPSIGEWHAVIPLDQSVTTFPDRGGLLVDIRVFASSPGLTFPVDGRVPNGTNGHTVVGPLAATQGTVDSTAVPVLGLLDDDPGTAPSLGIRGLPVTGSTYVIELRDAPAATPFLIAVGLSSTTWRGVPLPLDLGFIGAPSCFVFTGLDLNLSSTTLAQGDRDVGVTIPAGSSLFDRTIYHQAVVADPLANRLGLTTSNAIEVRIGGR